MDVVVAGTGAKSIYKAILDAEKSHINKLPLETLSDILTYTVTFFTRPRQCPTDLALVCKKWHEVSELHKELWSYIFVEEDTPIGKVKLQLRRSGDSPLSIYSLTRLSDHGGRGNLHPPVGT